MSGFAATAMWWTHVPETRDSHHQGHQAVCARQQSNFQELHLRPLCVCLKIGIQVRNKKEMKGRDGDNKPNERTGGISVYTRSCASKQKNMKQTKEKTKGKKDNKQVQLLEEHRKDNVPRGFGRWLVYQRGRADLRQREYSRNLLKESRC